MVNAKDLPPKRIYNRIAYFERCVRESTHKPVEILVHMMIGSGYGKFLDSELEEIKSNGFTIELVSKGYLSYYIVNWD